MHDLTLSPSTDPADIYRLRDALYASDLFIAALTKLDFFTWIGRRPSTVDGICAHFGFHARPVLAMTTLFIAQGHLTRDEKGVLHLTGAAREHLSKDSPWCVEPYFPRMKDRPIARDYLEILRTGHPARFASRDHEVDWHNAMKTEAFAEEFTAMMDSRGVLLGQAVAKAADLTGHRRLLDIAGGSGIYACALCAQWPELTATVFEKPPVDRIAARAIDRRGCGDRVDTLAGDMLAQPLPAGYDVHLFSNVLHDWDIPVVKQLLAASASALPLGGLLILHDAWLNEDLTGPLHMAEYSVLLVHVTQGRCYGLTEMRAFLEEAGFHRIQHHAIAGGRGVITAEKQ
ncbi:MAG: dnrK [Verrucomicrobiales bacterium]|nr:dnrK [Verrucomicrobiales bacterium]